MNNFKLSNKKIYNDSRSTIENLHNEKMENILSKYDNLDNKKNIIKFLEQKLKIIEEKTKEPNTKENKDNYQKNIVKLKNEIKILKKEIEDLNNDRELIDYMDKAWEFIETFTDNDMNITTKTNDNNTIKEDNEFIKNFNDTNDNNNDTNVTNDNNNDTNVTNDNNNVTNDNNNNVTNDNNNNVTNDTNDTNDSNKSNILQYITKTGKTNKGEEYRKYYDKCILNINYPTTNNSSSNNCKNCDNNDFQIDTKCGIIICTNCGMCEPFVEYSNSNINYNEYVHMETISQPFSYQRKNHFKEWLNQLQGKEVTVIPESVINLVLQEVKKERITNIEEITSDRIKKYLKKLGLNKYYEHIPNLISKITNKPPLTISGDFEKILLELFDKIQEPFKKHCPKERKNFLSYSYTLHKFCQLLGKKDYLIYFPLLKSREKLFEQERIWKGICNDLGWKFVPSI